MGWLRGGSPVFAADWRRSARGRGLYASRSVAVALALGVLASAWWSIPAAIRVAYLPRIIRVNYFVVVAVELILAVGWAPAMTAGAISEERRKRTLDDLLVTDLTAREIVLGKLGSGLVGLAMIVGALGPLLLMTAVLGGVDPAEVVAGSVVVVGIAALGSSLALVLSIWARRPVEAMAGAVAGVLALGSLADAWARYVGPPPFAIRATDARAILFDSGSRGFSAEWAGFVAGSLLGSAALVAVAARMLRSVGPRTSPRRRVGLGARGGSIVAAIARPAGRLRDRFDRAIGRRLGMPEPTLDAAPVLWRAWGRASSGWSGLAWAAYFVAGAGSAAYYLDHWLVAQVSGYLASAGLLLVGISAASAWEDERGQGAFVPLLTTPLGSREIVRQKWWGAYRLVPGLAILPALIVLFRGLIWGEPLIALPMAAVATVALVLAYGSVVVGLGLGIGLREPRTGRAIAWTVAILLGADYAWPWFCQGVGLPLIGANRWAYLPVSWVSPWMAAYLMTAWVYFLKREPELYPYLAAIPAWIAALGAIGWALRRSAERNFDRFAGRMPAESDPQPPTRERDQEGRAISDPPIRTARPSRS